MAHGKPVPWPRVCWRVRVVAWAAVLLLPFASAGCVQDPVPEVVWLLPPPEKWPARVNVLVTVEIQREADEWGRGEGFASATEVAAWATTGDAEPATLAHYAIAAEAGGDGGEAQPCADRSGGERKEPCRVDRVLQLAQEGDYWVRVRAVVDGVEAWSTPVRLTAT